VKYKDSLDAATWETLQNTASDNGTERTVTDASLAAARFYIVEIE
jgi:hypothetical protein